MAEPRPLNASERALIVTAAALRFQGPCTLGYDLGLARMLQATLADLLPGCDFFHPHLFGLPETVDALISLGDLTTVQVQRTGRYAREVIELEAALGRCMLRSSALAVERTQLHDEAMAG